MIYLSGHERHETRIAAQRGYPLGVLAQPDTSVHLHARHYRYWAADNGCFAKGDKFNLDAYLRWLAALPCQETCLFAVAPDVVGDAVATWQRSAPILPVIRGLGFKVAYVAQDGLDTATLDWGAFDCLFVGGSTEYKLSEDAYSAAREARQRGKWVHMGRVNSFRRIKAAAHNGYHSADGTFLKFGPDKNLPQLLGWLDTLRRQPFLAQEYHLS